MFQKMVRVSQPEPSPLLSKNSQTSKPSGIKTWVTSSKASGVYRLENILLDCPLRPFYTAAGDLFDAGMFEGAWSSNASLSISSCTGTG